MPFYSLICRSTSTVHIFGVVVDTLNSVYIYSALASAHIL